MLNRKWGNVYILLYKLQFLRKTQIPYITHVLTWSKIIDKLYKQMGSSGRTSSCEWGLRWTSTIPCLPWATSPEAAFVPAGEQACKAPGTQTCWAGPDPTGCQSTAARGRSGLAELERPGNDGWCLGFAEYPEREKVNLRWEEGWTTDKTSALNITQ